MAQASIAKQQERDRRSPTIEVTRSSKPGAAGRRLAARARRAHDEAGDDQGRRWPRPRRGCRPPQQKVEVAQANAATIQTRIDDATLQSPVTGRVLYRLAEPGEVLARRRQGADAGEPGRRLHGDLPAVGARPAALKIGAEGRITVDYDPKRAIAGYVSFVSPEAQFTPKQVETQQRAREADVPGEDPGAQGAGQPVHRAHQDRRARRRLRQGQRLGGLAGAAAEPSAHEPTTPDAGGPAPRE